MTWLNNPPADDNAEQATPEDGPAAGSGSMAETRESSTQQLTLHAVRALGIFFIRGAIASFVGLVIVGIGYAISLAGLANFDRGTTIFGAVVIGIGALVTLVWEIVVLVAASAELRKSGIASGGLGNWLGAGQAR